MTAETDEGLTRVRHVGDAGDPGDDQQVIAGGGLAAVECSAEQRIAVGDHLLIIARVTGVPYVADTGEPLIRFRRHYLPR